MFKLIYCLGFLPNKSYYENNALFEYAGLIVERKKGANVKKEQLWLNK